jgi:tetratricopeptide (TPR) repeat protein
VADYSKAIELDPKNVSNLYLRASLYRQMGKWEQALADYSKAIKLEPKTPGVWGNRASAYEQLKRFSEALADYSKAIEAKPESPLLWKERGDYFERLGQFDKALVDYAKAIERDPKFTRAWMSSGYLNQRLRRFDTALAQFSKGVELGDFWARFVRARHYAEMGRWEQAVADYEKGLLLAESDASNNMSFTQNEFAWLLVTCPEAKARNPRRAVQLAEKAVRAAPTIRPFRATLGVAQYCAGNWQAAIEAFNKIGERGRFVDVVELFVLAMAHVKLGNKVEGRRHYDRAVRALKEAVQRPNLYHRRAEDVQRFRSEAKELLGIKKP